MGTEIVVRLQYEATHSWPECPIEAVKFLKDPHRHIFHIKAYKDVSHSDREIEIIIFKREIMFHLDMNFKGDFGTRSCEDIALYLINEFSLSSCEVLEDGENGARVTT